MMGVPTFMVCSGYFDYGSRSPLLKRLESLLVPLLIWGTLTWCLSVAINKPTIDWSLCISWFRWIVGSGSWLYFVSALICCLLLSRLPKADYWLPIISIISIILSQLDVIPYNTYFTRYCNPLNFAVYFSIGRWLRHKNDDRDLQVSKALLLVALLLFAVSVPFAANYFTIGGLGIGLSSAVILLWIAGKWKWNFWQKAGSLSFVIYFIHMQLGGMMNTRLRFLLGNPFEPMKVIIIFAIVYATAFLLKKIIEKTNNNKLLKYLGFR